MPDKLEVTKIYSGAFSQKDLDLYEADPKLDCFNLSRKIDREPAICTDTNDGSLIFGNTDGTYGLVKRSSTKPGACISANFAKDGIKPGRDFTKKDITDEFGKIKNAVDELKDDLPSEILEFYNEIKDTVSKLS